jgi:hypothetical protein
LLIDHFLNGGDNTLIKGFLVHGDAIAYGPHDLNEVIGAGEAAGVGAGNEM